MHRRLIIALGLLVSLPLVSLTSLVIKVAGDERQMAAVQWRRLLEGRLQDLANGISAQTEAIERETLRTLEQVDKNAAGLRRLARRSPLVSQAFLLRSDGTLRFPPDDETTSAEERAFLTRTAPIWSRQAILYAPPRAEDTPAAQGQADLRPAPSAVRPRPRPVAKNAAPQLAQRRWTRRGSTGDNLVDLAEDRDSGWITWYWQEGLHPLLWRRIAEPSSEQPQPSGDRGSVIGVEVDRVAALARILGRLPDPAQVEGRIVLVNGRGEPLAQWGELEPAPGAVASARVSLRPPWDAWRLLYHPSPDQQARFMAGSVRWSLGLGLGAFSLSLIGLAIYFYRESDREMREAAQRVTFVTQVSHELKTPLTNIRLYAELLERDLDEDADKPRQRVGIIVSEAQRLSRLINNILTFSRQRRGNLTVAVRPIGLDGLVEGMVEQFRPALTTVGIHVALSLDAPHPTRADPDTVDQILANLLSNVEKYAAQGGWVSVSTRQEAGESIVVVRDRGPGISKEHRERIFQPFYRISDRLADGVTGTGIGLALSAELARKNGGTLRLRPSDEGACFELRLPRV